MSELNHDLGIMALKSCVELGDAVNKFIQEERDNKDSYIIPLNEVRFANGEGKVKISETVRGKIFIFYVISETIVVHIKCLDLSITWDQTNISKISRELLLQ